MRADFTQASQPAFTIPSWSHNDRSGAARTASPPTGHAAQIGSARLSLRVPSRSVTGRQTSLVAAIKDVWTSLCYPRCPARSWRPGGRGLAGSGQERPAPVSVAEVPSALACRPYGQGDPFLHEPPAVSGVEALTCAGRDQLAGAFGRWRGCCLPGRRRTARRAGFRCGARWVRAVCGWSPARGLFTVAAQRGLNSAVGSDARI